MGFNSGFKGLILLILNCSDYSALHAGLLSLWTKSRNSNVLCCWIEQVILS